jgi:hypothetical protein
MVLVVALAAVKFQSSVGVSVGLLVSLTESDMSEVNIDESALAKGTKSKLQRKIIQTDGTMDVFKAFPLNNGR